MKYLLPLLMLVCGVAQAQHLSGSDLTLGSGAPAGIDGTFTNFRSSGGLLFSPNVVGPEFGPGLCGMDFRVTGEANLTPSWVMRCNSYQWESDGPLKWYMLLNTNGLAVGVQPLDPAPYPMDKISVTHGDVSVRCVTPDENCGYLVRKGVDALWYQGVLRFLGTGDDFVLAKFKDGAWTIVRRDAY